MSSGSGTAPTEGDIARWARWSSSTHPPRDWLLVDERRFRSVVACTAALRQRERLPTEEVIAGDWERSALDDDWRAGIRVTWAETKLRTRAQWKL